MTDRPSPVGLSVPCWRAGEFASRSEDLDIDFAALDTAALGTRLLSACLRDADDAPLASHAVARWNVAQRLQGLLAIARSSVGEQLPALARCTDAECGGQIELDLGLRQFERDAPTQLEWQAPDGTPLRCRLPDTGDLAAWRAHGGDEAWLARRLVRLVAGQAPAPDWTFPSAWLAPFAAALEAADPLTALTLEVPCPFCEHPTPVAIDLEALLLDALRRHQQSVLEEVHRLARAYHWSEAQIVAMPGWRRRRYLARLQAEFA